jgi:hypothetical protein
LPSKRLAFGPITFPILTEKQRQHLAGAAVSLQMVRARLENSEIYDFTTGLDRIAEQMTRMTCSGAA